MITLVPWRVYLFVIILVIFGGRYLISLVAYDRYTNSMQEVRFGGPPVEAKLYLPKAMYVGTAYDLSIKLIPVHMSGESITPAEIKQLNNKRDLPPNIADAKYAIERLSTSVCKVDAPDFSIAPDAGPCYVHLSPKTSGNPIVVVRVTNRGKFPSASIFHGAKLPDVGWALTVPVGERPSLTTLSAILGVLVAIVGLLFRGGETKSDHNATTRLLQQIAKRKRRPRW